MDTGSENILPAWWAETAAAAELARLREQRWRLGRVRDDVEATSRRLAAQAVGAGWRSPAQQAYERRLADLVGVLEGAGRAVDDALYAVDVAIERVKAAR
ncbi:hypothetical protein [Cryobacterium sp. AP23]